MALYLALYAPADKPAGPETSGTVNVKKITEMFQAFADNYIGWLEQQTFLNEQSKIRELTNEEKKKLQDLNENIKRKEAAEKAAKEAAAKEAAEKAAKEAAAKEAAEKAAKEAAAKEAAAKEKARKAAAKEAQRQREEAEKAAEKAAADAKAAKKPATKTKEDEQKELEESRNEDYALHKLIANTNDTFKATNDVMTEFSTELEDNNSDLKKKRSWDKNVFWPKVLKFIKNHNWITIVKEGSPTVLKSDANQDDIYRKYKGAEENKGYLYSDTDDYQKTVDFRTAFYINESELRKPKFDDPRSWLHILLLRAHAVDTKSN